MRLRLISRTSAAKEPWRSRPTRVSASDAGRSTSDCSMTGTWNSPPANTGGRRTVAARRPTKLVHNIVLSMPRPTPPDKVLTAARQFARQKFAQHRYAMVLHTHQQHPHVHLVVKAESELGRRLHIDKQLLRDWREDFARLMREQGIAANATPRAIRGENKTRRREGIFQSTALRQVQVRRDARTCARNRDRAVTLGNGRGPGARKVARDAQIAGINLDEGRRRTG